MLEIAADFPNAVAIPVNTFFAAGLVFFPHIEDVRNAVFVQVMAFGLPGVLAFPGHMRALAGAVETQAKKQTECNPSVFHFAHEQFVAYP